MPAYDYRCTACRCTFEVNRPAGDTTAVPCPECGGETKRVFSPVGIHFKGSGFHNTDYKNKKALPVEPKKADAPKSDSACPASSGGGCANCPAASSE